MCMCEHEKESHASGPGFSFTYCKIEGCECEGYEEKELETAELDFEED